MASCPGCRASVQQQRTARRALSSAADVAPTAEFLERLVAVGRSGSGERYGPGSTFSVPRHRQVDRARPSRSLWVSGAVAAGGAAAVVGGLFVLGGSSPGDESVSLVAARSILRAATPVAVVDPSGSDPSGSAAVRSAPGGSGALDGARDRTASALKWMRGHDWVVPAVVPSGLDITEVGLASDGALVVELVGSDGVVVLTERRGVLDDDLAGAERLDLGPVTAYQVSTDPWTALTQVGDTVVVVASHGASGSGRELVAALDGGEQDPAAGRIARGWSEVAGAVRASWGR